MNKRFFLLFYIFSCVCPYIAACTSAIIGADKSPYGRPLLWKNRDTSNFDNKIEYVNASKTLGEFNYVALFNASDSLLKEAWMGMNDHGFAVMNTASYNLKNDTVSEKNMDKEGLIMTQALKKCKTVKEFATLLDTLPKPLGVEANFGVIDAFGNGAYFETDNYSYTIYDINDNPDHIIIRTNYSHSGRPKEGFGFIREANAQKLMDPYINDNKITPELFTEVLSHSFYHDLLKKDYLEEDTDWIVDQDFIPRYTSVASIVIEGCHPLSANDEINTEKIIDDYIMWTALGYPPCAEVFPVKCNENGVALELRGTTPNGHSPQCDKVLERKNEVFPFKQGNGNKYIDKNKLFNKEGTGYLQVLAQKNQETYTKTRERKISGNKNL